MNPKPFGLGLKNCWDDTGSNLYAKCLLLRHPYTMTTRKQMKGRTNEAFVAG